MIILLKDGSANIVTTMIEYYKYPNDSPGRKSMPSGSCYTKVEYFEKAFVEDINSLKFIPYLQLHEFEALLFSDISAFDIAFPQHNKSKELKRITKKIRNPEEIDDNECKAPSKRIKKIFPDYQKISHGTLITKKIGTDIIRNNCRHFNEWLDKLINT